jgi:RNA polymerase sigma factor (sigma-70 family)
MVATTGASDCLASVNWFCPCCPVVGDDAPQQECAAVPLLAKDVSKRHRTGAHPPHPSASPLAAARIGPGALRCRASLPRRGGRPVGVGFSAVPQVASPASSSRRQQQSTPLIRSALRARNAMVLEHLPLADALASAAARRLFPLVEREDLIQVAREALVRSAPRCRAGEPAGPYLRRCITGALQHHLRDRVRLVRISRREHEKGTWPLGHTSLDAPAAGEHSLLDQLEAPAAEPALEPSLAGPALEQLVEQLPAAQATALRLTVLEGLSLRAAAAQLQISPMAVSHREVRLAIPPPQKKALAALRQQLVGAG